MTFPEIVIYKNYNFQFIQFSDEREKINLDDDTEKAISWLSERDPAFVPFFMKYLIQDDELYPNSEEMKNMEPSKWWYILFKRAKLHCCPTSSAS